MPACIASTSTIRPGACLKSCVSPSRGINLILGMRTHITRGPTSGFALSLGPETDWRQKLDHGCQGLGSWSTFMTPPGAYRHAHVAQCPFFHPKDAMRHNRDISGAWTTFVLDKSEGFTQAGVERFKTRSAHMFGLFWERKPSGGRIFSRLVRDLTPRNNFWQISKTRLPRPLTSPVACLAIRKHCSMHPHPWTSCLGLDSICRRATWHSIRAKSRGTTTRSR